MSGRGRMSNGFNSYDRDDNMDAYSVDSMQQKPNQRRDSSHPSLHVTNIPPGLDEKGLSNVFTSECNIAPVRVYISKTKKNQQANTYWGFVEYRTAAEAQTAIAAVHKKPPYELVVQFSKAYQEGNREKPEKYTGNMGSNRGGQHGPGKDRNNFRPPRSTDESFNDDFGDDSNSFTFSPPPMGSMGPTRGGQHGPARERNNFRSPRTNDGMFNDDFGEDSNSYSFSSPMEKSTNNPAEKLPGLPIEKYNHVEITDEMDLHVAAYMSSRAKDLTLNDLSDLCSEIKLALPFKPGQCTYCLRTAIYTCSRCKAWYCSEFCRMIHWPQHKDKCNPRSVFFEKDGTLSYKDVPDVFCNEQPFIQRNMGNGNQRNNQRGGPGGDNYRVGGGDHHRMGGGDNHRMGGDNHRMGGGDNHRMGGGDNHRMGGDSHRGGGGGGDRRGGGRQFGGRPDRNAQNSQTKTHNENDSFKDEESFNGRVQDKPQNQKSCNLDKAPIPASSFTKVTVGAVKRDNEFWAYRMDDYQKQGAMMTELKRCVLEGDHSGLRIETGSKCIAPYEGDWYRAEIIQIFRDNVKVVFVDFGNESEVKKCDLKLLPDYIASEPAMAHRFVLAQSPDNPKLHEELTFSIKPIMQEKSGRWVVQAEGVNYSAANGFVEQ